MLLNLSTKFSTVTEQRHFASTKAGLTLVTRVITNRADGLSPESEGKVDHSRKQTNAQLFLFKILKPYYCVAEKYKEHIKFTLSPLHPFGPQGPGGPRPPGGPCITKQYDYELS